MVATSFISNFTLLFIIYHLPKKIFPLFARFCENRLTTIFEFYFTGGLKLKLLTRSLPNIFNKEGT